MFKVSVHRNLLLERMRFFEAEEDKKKKEKEEREKAWREKVKKGKGKDKDSEKSEKKPEKKKKEPKKTEPKAEPKKDTPSARKNDKKPEKSAEKKPEKKPEPKSSSMPKMPSFEPPKDKPGLPKMPSLELPKEKPPKQAPKLKAEPELPPQWQQAPNIPSLAQLASQEMEPWHKKAGLPKFEPKKGEEGPEMPPAFPWEKPEEPKAKAPKEPPKMRAEPATALPGEMPPEDLPSQWQSSGAVKTPTLSSLIQKQYGKDILPKEPKWKVGDTVNVGWMRGLKVLGKKGNIWNLQKPTTGVRYDFVPHRGIYRVN